MEKKMQYFIFESGKAVLGPCNRWIDARNEAREYGNSNPVIRCFETDSRDNAEKQNKELEKELSCNVV